MAVRPLEQGTEIGTYVIEAPISVGGMGAVHRARRLADGLEVAIKQPLEDADAVRFQIEARLLERLRHPRVVRVIDHFADSEGDYLVMELVRGASLDAVLERSGPLPVSEAVEHIRQACEALAYVHEQQVVHRDVKPANLILSGDGIVLVDFGIAREQSTTHATRALGTPRYAAPEVLSGTAATSRSDVYGLAATLWALIAGTPPTFGKRLRLPAAGPTVEAALHAGLEPDPELRLPTAEAFAQALGEGLAERGSSLALSVARPSVPPAVLETAVRAAAAVFGATATSIALLDGDELVYESAWGGGADEIVGVRLAPGEGIAAHVAASGRAEAVPNCREDPRWAREIALGTGYIPHTMLVLPLGPPERPFGVLQILDRLDGGRYGPADVERGRAFAELTHGGARPRRRRHDPAAVAVVASSHAVSAHDPAPQTRRARGVREELDAGALARPARARLPRPQPGRPGRGDHRRVLRGHSGRDRRDARRPRVDGGRGAPPAPDRAARGGGRAGRRLRGHRRDRPRVGSTSRAQSRVFHSGTGGSAPATGT